MHCSSKLTINKVGSDHIITAEKSTAKFIKPQRPVGAGYVSAAFHSPKACRKRTDQNNAGVHSKLKCSTRALRDMQ
jgi:hypothetical protein